LSLNVFQILRESTYRGLDLAILGVGQVLKYLVTHLFILGDGASTEVPSDPPSIAKSGTQSTFNPDFERSKSGNQSTSKVKRDAPNKASTSEGSYYDEESTTSDKSLTDLIEKLFDKF